MKTFSRTSLPVIIHHNHKDYVLDLKRTEMLREQPHLKMKHCIQVNVLQRNLRGREDLHGKKYQPHPFIYHAREKS